MKNKVYLFYLVVDRTSIQRNRYLINEEMIMHIGKDTIATLYGWTCSRKRAKEFMRMRDKDSFVEITRRFDKFNYDEVKFDAQEAFCDFKRYLGINYPLQEIRGYPLLSNPFADDIFYITKLELEIITGKYDGCIDTLIENASGYLIDRYENTYKEGLMSGQVFLTSGDLKKFKSARPVASVLINKIIRKPKDEFDRWIKYALPTLDLSSVLKYMDGGNK